MEHWKNLSLENIQEIIDEVLEIEKWKDIPLFEGLYQVSSFGRVKSLGRCQNLHYGTKWVEAKILKQTKGTTEYAFVRVSKNGKVKFFTSHRLVGFCFIPNPLNKREINHKDCNKTNNFFKNLEWATRLENQRHALINGIVFQKAVVLLNENNACIDSFPSLIEASRKTKMDRCHISDVCKGVVKHPDKKWMFKEDYEKLYGITGM